MPISIIIQKQGEGYTCHFEQQICAKNACLYERIEEAGKRLTESILSDRSDQDDLSVRITFDERGNLMFRTVTKMVRFLLCRKQTGSGRIN